MNILDMTARDCIGAAAQWERFLRDELGFDYEVSARVEFYTDRGVVRLNGQDVFQKSTAYAQKVGEVWLECHPFPLDAEWDTVCANVWEKLTRCMRRDEREMRHSLQRMGSFLENDTFSSAVGKMVAERIRSIRDDVSAHLLEYQAAKPVHAA